MFCHLTICLPPQPKTAFLLPASRILLFPLKLLEASPPYLNFYWLFPLSVQQSKFHALFAGMSLDVEFCLSLTLGLHIGYVGGEEQPLTPLSEYLSLSTDFIQVASCLKPMVICYKVITDYLITI